MLFLIFKIIGIIILSVLTAVVLFLCYLLFSPLTYKAAGEITDRKSLVISAHDMLRFVSFTFRYTDGEKESSLVLLWGLIKKGKANKADSHEEAEEVKPIAVSEEDAAGGEPSGQGAQIIKPQDDDDLKPDDAAVEEEEAPDEDSVSDEEREFMDAVTKEAYASASEVKVSLSDRIDRSVEKVQDGAKKASAAWDELNDTRNQEAIAYICRQAVILIKKILPRIEMADVDYALSEPDLTGELTGALALCPCCYGRKVHLSPDFAAAEAFVRGEVRLRGDIRLFRVVWFALKLILHKDCRRLYKKIRRG